MTILIVMALSWLGLSVGRAQTYMGDTLTDKNIQLKNFQTDKNLQDSTLTVSLITCYPGEEIYELCGHSGIRVRGEGIDSIWNYGIFDFNQPNFVYRFVKGETDYKGMAYPFRWFMPEYVEAGRKVVEQDLNLTPQESRELLKLLRSSVQPENAVYRYNYVKDNCSLRILERIETATPEEIVYPDTVRYGTFRNEMRAFHKNYPWYQLGIDLALGSGLDYKLNSREEMFAPIVMMENVGNARFSDGRPLVKATRVLNEGKEDVILPPTPWALSPLFWAWIVTAVVCCCVALFNLIKGQLYLPLYGVWFFLLGLVGWLSAFLVFVSVHEATSPNVLIWWVNPLQWLFVIGIAVRKLKILAYVMSFYNIIVSGVLLIASPWWQQSFNPAFYPLLLSTFVLAAMYAILGIKSSYKIR